MSHTCQHRLLHYPKTILILILIVTVFLFWILREKAYLETDLDEYMPAEHSAFVYSDQAEEWFDIKDGMIIAIEHPESIYNPGTLTKIKDLSRTLQQRDGIDKSDVTSLYTADNIVGSEWGLDVTRFYTRVPQSAAELSDLHTRVRGNEMIHGRLVAENDKIALIVTRIEDDLFSQDFYQEMLDLAREYEGPETVYVAGRPIVEGTLARLAPQDMQRMIPLVVGVILLFLFLLLRSVKTSLLTFMVVVVSTIWTFGLMALLGIPVYSVSTMIPVMLIAIGVAYGVHMFSHLDMYLVEQSQPDRLTAVVDMLRNMWKPVTMAAVTTAVGFVSLLTSQVYPIKYFGLFTAFGVLSAMILSLIMLPAGILVFGLPRPGKHAKRSRDDKPAAAFAHGFTTRLLRAKVRIWTFTGVVVVLSVIGIQRVWINSSFLDKFEKNSPIVKTDQFINEHFGGTSTVNLILESEHEQVFKSPEVLRVVDRLQEDTETVSQVGNSFSLVDYLKRMNKVMHADDEQFNTIPNSRELIAQYLLLYEMAGDPENLWRVTDYDYRKLNVTFQLKSDNSQAIQAALARIEQYTDELNAHDVQIHYAGSGYKGLVFTDLILKGQISSLVLSLVIVIGLLSVMFKRLKAGLIGAIPISITAVISFGAMGLLNIPLSTTTALLSSIAIGIGIDYAVHFIDRYQINSRETGDMTLSLQRTMHHSGRAIVFNALVVIAGFSVLLFSVFPPNRALGGLVSLNMFTSFLGTVTIMVLVIEQSRLFCRHRNRSGQCTDHKEME